jgi:hypothetical protein
MARLHYNGVSGTLGGSLTNSGTTITLSGALTHSGGTNVPTITGSDYLPLSILDSSSNLSEIVYLTAYTAGATTGTITRGQEGTSGVTHAAADRVTHALTATDIAAAAYTETITTVTGGSSQTLSAPTSATIQRVNLNSANCTFTFPTATAGYSFTVETIQDASGFRAVTWPASVRWADAAAPTLSTGSNKRDLFSFLCTDGSTWLGFVAGQNYAA